MLFRSSLKAMGVSNLRLIGMILLQSAVVGVLGYCIGIGLAALFGIVMSATVKGIPPAFFMTWQVMVGAALAVVVIAMAASLISIRRVIVLEPAIVFK